MIKNVRILSLMLLICMSTLTFSSCTASDNKKNEPEAQKVLSINYDTVKVKTDNLFDGMDAKVNDILNDGTEYSVYLAYPQKSSEVYIYNSQKWRSASMIKVFILATVMDKVKNGEISLDRTIILQSSDKVGGAGILAGYATGTQLTLREVLKLMITESDNTATNIIIDLVGMQTINKYIAQNGYHDTLLQRKMMDTQAINEGRENYSSVKDLGSIFTKIYNHNCVGYEQDEIMVDFLIGQTDTDCFPAALPGKVIAHKTGALVGLYDDGGIIFNGDEDTILVIMTENFTSESTVINHMKRFARAVVSN